MKEVQIRCKRCKKRFTAYPYSDLGGYPVYCASCAGLVRGVNEVSLHCQRCKKRFTVVRRDLRIGIPPYCESCGQAQWKEQQQMREQARLSKPPGPSAWAKRMHSIRAKGLPMGRYAPKVKRLCRVWWDQRAKMYCGAVCDVPVDPHSRSMWAPDWEDGSVIYEVEAPTIAELAERMAPYGELDPATRRALYADTPPSLRDQAGTPAQ